MRGQISVVVYLEYAIWKESIYAKPIPYRFPNLATAKRFARENLSEIIPYIHVVEDASYTGVILASYHYEK